MGEFDDEQVTEGLMFSLVKQHCREAADAVRLALHGDIHVVDSVA